MKADPKHSLADLFGMAIKAEIEAQEIYSSIHKQSKNFVLKEKMQFLASEEKKHEAILRGLYRQQFGDEKPRIPDETMAPVPAWKPEEGGKISNVLKAAMQTELDSNIFYHEMATRVDDAGQKAMFKYLAAMEQTHYHLLEVEYNAALEIEDYDQFDPAVHWGA
jgi:rubrerythrin